ncbi:MAG: sugar ABC transporter permease [Planctomycetota bacterium]|jgi:multiple sugar transport system permease protein|nr:sugar ABC transporter permease [Planctomycetota bacterium]
MDNIDMAAYRKRPFLVRARPYFIILPALLLTIGILYPFLTAIYYSLTSLNLQRPGAMRFVWFQNWIRMLREEAFWHAVRVTLQYALTATFIELALGLGLGLAICRRDNWFARLLKVSLVFPLMIAPVVAVIIWQLMTSNTIGILEKLLNLFGVYKFRWASSADTAMFTAIMIDVWVYTPFILILVIAGINSLPKSPFEAARVDGASEWFTFKNLTLPMLKPFLYIALIFRLMAAMQEYGIIWALTRGGPGDTLLNLSVTTYIRGFTQYRFGQMIPYVLTLWVIVYIVSQILVRKWLKVQKTAGGR